MKPTAKKIGILLAGVCVALLFLLGGCSLKPTESDGQRAVQNQITQDSEGRITLTEFHKTNGQAAEVNGVKLYSLEFEAEIAFTEACRWLLADPVNRKYSFRTAAIPQSNMNQIQTLLGHLNTGDGSAVAKGQIVKITGTISFEKKEKGWSVEGITIGNATLVASSKNDSQITNERQNNPNSNALTAVSQPPSTIIPKSTPSQPSKDELLLILTDLRNIDAAENQWALMNRKNTGDSATESDIKLYLPNNQFPVHPLGGSYILNSVGQNTKSSIYGSVDDITSKYHDLIYPKERRDFGNMTPDQIRNLVANDLRWIDGAKNQWALEQAGARIFGKIQSKNWGSDKDKQLQKPDEDDLKPYLYGGYFPEHPPAGNYIINAIDQPPVSSVYGNLLQ